MRVILAKYYSILHNTQFDLDTLSIDLKRFFLNKQPRYIFTHFGSRAINNRFTDIRLLANKKVFFLVRDPRDIAVSYYFQLSKRESKTRQSISDFIKDKDAGIDSIIKFFNYIYNNRGVYGKFYLSSYENLKNNTFDEMLKIISFFDEVIDEPALRSSIEFASFENMKKMESDGAFGSQRLRPADTSDPESFKVRRGKVGGYRDYLNDEDIAFLHEKIQSLNPIFNYQRHE